MLDSMKRRSSSCTGESLIIKIKLHLRGYDIGPITYTKLTATDNSKVAGNRSTTTRDNESYY